MIRVCTAARLLPSSCESAIAPTTSSTRAAEKPMAISLSTDEFFTANMKGI